MSLNLSLSLCNLPIITIFYRCTKLSSQNSSQACHKPSAHPHIFEKVTTSFYSALRVHQHAII